MNLTDDDLESAILFPAVATAMIEIVKRCHHPMGQFARLEKERFRQQERANKEAVERCNAEEQRDELAELLRFATENIVDVDTEWQAKAKAALAKVGEVKS